MLSGMFGLYQLEGKIYSDPGANAPFATESVAFGGKLNFCKAQSYHL